MQMFGVFGCDTSVPVLFITMTECIHCEVLLDDKSGFIFG